jgi:hypothetical protein
MNAGRFPRSTREAFAHERFPAIEHYRRPWNERVTGWLGLVGTLSLFALLGVILAYRG